MHINGIRRWTVLCDCAETSRDKPCTHKGWAPDGDASFVNCAPGTGAGSLELHWLQPMRRRMVGLKLQS